LGRSVLGKHEKCQADEDASRERSDAHHDLGSLRWFRGTGEVMGGRDVVDSKGEDWAMQGPAIARAPAQCTTIGTTKALPST
jgi:hypothetical protein